MDPRHRPPPPRAILFDAGNTLIQMDASAIAARLSADGRAVSAAEVEDAELRARVQLDDDLAGGASTESADTALRYLRYSLGHLGIRDEALIQEIARWRRDYNPPFGVWTRAADGATAALARAKAAGLMTGVISNSNGFAERILAEMGLTPHLDFVIDSFLVGVEKPDPRIFQIALERAGVPAAAARYVGDLYSVDVLGARRAGIDAILLDPRGYWGPRDCQVARDIEHAVALCLDGISA